jgi:hypothetical protein
MAGTTAQPALGAKADYSTLSEYLKRIYWSSAQHELCNMILFFVDSLRLDVNERYTIEADDLDCNNFKEIFELWCKH